MTTTHAHGRSLLEKIRDIVFIAMSASVLAVCIVFAVVAISLYSPLRQAITNIEDATASVKGAAERLVAVSSDFTSIAVDITEVAESAESAVDSAITAADGVSSISGEVEQVSADVTLLLATLDRIANTLDAIADRGLGARLAPPGYPPDWASASRMSGGKRFGMPPVIG
jgi:methyl-accepting chemotaxis protein